jgi:hypothetical protein
MPLVSSSILSIDQMKAPSFRTAPFDGRIREASVVSGPSPLEQYLTERSLSRDDLNRLSQNILEASLSVKREGGALADLLRRFTPSERLSAPAASMLSALAARHSDRLLTGLQEERDAIQQLQLAVARVTTQPDPSIMMDQSAALAQLVSVAERNQALCQELISSGDTPPRSATAIASDLSESINQLRLMATILSITPLGTESSTSKP